MILPFKPQFVDKIVNGSKIHTIRLDPHQRWKPGRTIHFATGVRTNNYKQFKTGICSDVQSIYIKAGSVWVDSRLLSYEETVILAKNDGFEFVEDLFFWFPQHCFDGRIIHWTKFNY